MGKTIICLAQRLDIIPTLVGKDVGSTGPTHCLDEANTIFSDLARDVFVFESVGFLGVQDE